MGTTVSLKAIRLGVCGVLTALLVAGCGGGGDKGPYAIGGSVSGLVGTVVLQNNGGDNLSVSANGNFTFVTTVTSGGSYNVTVLTQPTGRTCSVANAGGMATGKVSNVTVTCVANLYSLGGMVSGLNGTVVLAETEAGNSVAVSTAGNYQFPFTIGYGETYAVSVYRQPVGQTCSVTGGATGTVAGNVGNVAVSCTNNPYTVSGTVSGLTSGSVGLQLNFADNITVGNGSFIFPKALAAGSSYQVSFTPGTAVGYNCTFTNSVGTANASIGNVAIACTPTPTTTSIGGNVQGLTGTLVLRNSVNGETVTRSANGSFTFPTALALGAEYGITVQTQPAGQNCTVTNGSVLASVVSPTLTVVSCSATTETHTVGGTVTGLKAPLRLGITLNNTFLDVAVGTSPVSFTFPVSLQFDTEFQVYVFAQPTGQTCVIPHSGSHVAHANITDVVVTCVDNTTDYLTGTYTSVGEDFALTFYGNGVYVFAVVDNDASCGTSKGSGVEMGAYRYNATAGTLALISNALDTNGANCGVWRNGASLVNGAAVKTGVGQGSVLTVTLTSAPFSVTLVPVKATGSLPIGSFFVPGSSSFAVFGENGRYLEANANDDPASNAPAGVEYGCFSYTGTFTGTLTPNINPATCSGAVDTDNTAGFSDGSGVAATYSVNPALVNFNNNGLIGFRVLAN